MRSLDPAAHVGPQSYISPTARLADGRSYLDRTTEIVIEVIRHDSMYAKPCEFGGARALQHPERRSWHQRATENRCRN